ncbi:MAG: hypothetical protein QM372_10835 [Bacillota bacterium]|jgi:hypothetical protein|nr:hypothetical protein [Bacillota bacterium]
MTGIECFLEIFPAQSLELIEDKLRGTKLLEAIRKAYQADEAGMYLESRMLLEEAYQIAVENPAYEDLILEMARSARPADPGGGNYGGGNYGGGGHQQSSGGDSDLDDCLKGACLGLLLQAICEGGC